MVAIIAIARVSFGEALRRRIFWTLLIFALLLCGGSLVLSEIVVGDRVKVIKDLGLSGMSFFGLVMAIWLGSEAFGRALENCPSEPLLSRAVSRESYLIAHYLGLALVLLVSAAAMGALSWLPLLALGEPFGPEMLWAGLLIYVELLVAAAAGFLFAIVLRPGAALYATLALVIVGRCAADARQLLAAHQGGLKLLAWLYTLMPNLSRLDIKAAAVHGLPLPPLELASSALYGVGYAGLLLLLAMAALRRRDLS